jgi:hypothetical protein
MRAKLFREWGFEEKVVYKIINEKEKYYLLAFDDKELEKIVRKLKRKLGKRAFDKYVKIRKTSYFTKTIPFSALKKLIPIPKHIVKDIFGNNKLKAFLEASYKYSSKLNKSMLIMKNTNYEFDFNNNYNYYLIWKSDESYLEKNLILFSYSFTHEYIIKLNKAQLRKLINEMLIELVGDKSAELQGQ